MRSEPRILLALLGAPFLSATWLNSIRQAPWTSFYSEAWISGLLLLVAIGTLFRRRERLVIPFIVWPLVALGFIFIAQWATGQVSFLGLVWTPALVSFGTAACIVWGSNIAIPHRPAFMLWLYAGIILASSVSVAAQLDQRIDYGSALSVIGMAPGPSTHFHKASAYLGQPNILATLLLIAWTGCLWIQSRRFLDQRCTLLLVSLCAAGVAWSGSRTGLLSLFALIVLISTRSDWRQQFKWALILTPLVYVCARLLPTLETADIGLPSIPQQELTSVDLRWAAWKFLAGASLENPWLGIGWGQIAHLYFDYSPTSTSPTPQAVFTAAHSVILDLGVGIGWPLALILLAFFFRGVLQTWIQVSHSDDKLALLSLLPVGIHSLLELPHQYAYIMLPLGLILGLTQTAQQRSLQSRGVPVSAGWAGWCLLGLLWGITVYDYLNVRERYLVARFESARIANTNLMPYPPLLVLTHFEHQIDFFRTPIAAGIDPHKLKTMTQAVKLIPLPNNVMRMSAMLELNQQHDEARRWLDKVCVWATPQSCTSDAQNWKVLQNSHPQLRSLEFRIQK